MFSLAYYIVNWFNSSRYELTRPWMPTINPCICNSLYRHIFLLNHYCLFVCSCMCGWGGIWCLCSSSKLVRVAQAAELQTSQILLYTTQYLHGTFTAALSLIMRDWMGLRVGSMLLTLSPSYFRLVRLSFLLRVNIHVN